MPSTARTSSWRCCRPQWVTASTLRGDIGQGVGGRHTVIVLAGKKLDANSNALGSNGGGVEAKASQAAGAHQSGGFTKANVTGAITQLASEIKTREAQLESGGGSSSSTSGAASSSKGGSGSGRGSSRSVVIVLHRCRRSGVLRLPSPAAPTARIRRTPRRKSRRLYERLGNDVLTLDPKGDEVTGQALADAAERYSAAGSAIANATTVDQLWAARQTAIEGLYAARVARQRLGLDPGPDLPTLGGAPGKSLESSQQVAFGDKQYEGHPDYRPGAPTTTAGARSAAAGCRVAGTARRSGSPSCSAPSLAAASAVAGAAAGYGTGYDQGFEQGYDQAQQNDGGNDWGGGGGGDWGWRWRLGRRWRRRRRLGWWRWWRRRRGRLVAAPGNHPVSGLPSGRPMRQVKRRVGSPPPARPGRTTGRAG